MSEDRVEYRLLNGQTEITGTPSDIHAEHLRLREENKQLRILWLHELGDITEGAAARLLGMDRLTYRIHRGRDLAALKEWAQSEWGKIRRPREA